jgi:transposase
MNETLFDLPEVVAKAKEGGLAGCPRLKRANRQQIEWRAVDLDSLLPTEHQARVVWEWAQLQDLSPLYQAIRAVEGHAGQSAIDPRILLGLWMLATLDGIGSARALERMCEEHIAYRWICGGVGVNYHTLADFRVSQEAYLDQLLISSVAALRVEGLVSLKRVAQDGKKIRASAGSSSFHRQKTLDKHLAEAREQVETLRKEIAADPCATTRREQAARERALRERQERIEKAQEQLLIMQKQAEKTGRDKRDAKNPKKKERRASSTDPEARVMKMADGGFRPAENAQFCTDCESDIIVAVMVTQQGNDTGLASPMMDKIEQDYQVLPEALLADTSYASLEEIVKLSDQGVTPYIAIPIKGKSTAETYLPKAKDAQQVADWRIRMGSEAGQAIYQQRGEVAELVHAVVDQFNLARMRVRGLKKVRTVLLWFALAHNLLRTHLLRKKLAQTAS